MVDFSGNIKCFGPAEANSKNTAGCFFLSEDLVNDNILFTLILYLLLFQDGGWDRRQVLTAKDLDNGLQTCIFRKRLFWRPKTIWEAIERTPCSHP